VYFETRGQSGPPIVLIRGFGCSLRTWNGVDAELGRDHRVLLIDNRGVGRSSAGLLKYSIAEMAEDVAGCMGSLGWPAAHLVGTSMGAMIALELALSRPELVRSLVLASIGLPPPVGAGMCRGEGLKLLLRTLRFALAGVAGKLCGMNRNGGPCTAQEQLEQAKRAGQRSLVGVAGHGAAVLSYSCNGELRQLQLPVLLLHGMRDALFPWRNAVAVARHIRGAQVQLWPDCGHDLVSDAPERLAATVRWHVAAAESRCPARRPARPHRAHGYTGSHDAADSRQPAAAPEYGLLYGHAAW
jgi:pimeloyl-ACP methyl ester carboxylesterase